MNGRYKMIFQLLLYIGIGLFSFWIGTMQVHSNEETKIEKVNEVNISKTSTDAIDNSSELNSAELKNEIFELKKQLKEISIDSNSTLSDNCKILYEKIDSRFFDEAYQKIYSSDNLKEKTRNLKVLALLKNEDAKKTLLKVVNDIDEPLEMRLDVIRAIDWGGQVNESIKLFNAEDESIKSTLVLAMGESTLNDEEKETFQRELMGVFSEKSDEFLQIAAIDYLANNNPEMLKQINVAATDEEVFKKITQHLEELSLNNLIEEGK